MGIRIDVFVLILFEWMCWKKSSLGILFLYY